MKNIFTLLLLYPFILFAQLTESFSDGDFSVNPSWHGDSNEFQISTYSNSSWSQQPRLQLNGTTADTSILYMSTPLTGLDNMEWGFWARLSLNTSGSNNARVYLVSDHANLKGSLNGYFVMFGDDNNDALDSISLWKQSGLSCQKLIAGHIAWTGASKNYRIKVTRDNAGLWKLLVDTLGQNNFLTEGTATDFSFGSSAFFGVRCKYTLSNKTSFYFDDIYVGPQIVDTIPPSLVSLSVVSQTQLDVCFSENLETASAQNTANYSAATLGNPSSAVKDPLNALLVHLTFSTPFASGMAYLLTVQNVMDMDLNAMGPESREFAWYTARPFDIVINEIMADPDPPIGLPDDEYLELFNRTSVPVSLKNWNIITGSTDHLFPEVTIEADSFLIIAHNNAQPALAVHGAFAGFSSFSLTNSGSTIILKNASGNIIHAVSYSDSWYDDAAKDEGGWALEQVDPSNPCGGSANWKASNDPSGGTPGRVNSLNSEAPDHQLPELLRAAVDPAELSWVRLFFSEPLDSTSLKDPLKYVIDHGIGNPASVKLVPVDFNSVILNLAGQLQYDVTYHVTVMDSILDCAGNLMATNSSVRFAVPVSPDSGDIVINEILSNPRDDGVDYIEVYNRSGHVFDFRNLDLASYDTIAGYITDVNKIFPDGYLIFPGDYVALTVDPLKVKEQYQTQNPNGFARMVSMPSYNNDDGTVVLCTHSLRIIDMVKYDSRMQFPLLASSEGVSLERVNYDRPAYETGNWHSAAEAVGFGTPAYENSQYAEVIGGDGTITISPEVFSPDNDGYNDMLNIAYAFDEPGYVASVSIFDAGGRLIRDLVRNQLLGTSGVFSWDGTTVDGEKANIGICVISFEVFDLNGNARRYKRAAVLAGKSR